MGLLVCNHLNAVLSFTQRSIISLELLCFIGRNPAFRGKNVQAINSSVLEGKIVTNRSDGVFFVFLAF